VASLAEGKSRLLNPLLSGDTLSCLSACRVLGADVIRLTDLKGGEIWEVDPLDNFEKPPEQTIDVGNSGTTLYLALALAALQEGRITFTGDAQIRTRSAEPLLKSLEDLGAEVIRQNGGCAPFTVRGPLRGGETAIECPTSQYLSALLLAAPLIPAPGETVIKVDLLNERPYVEMTLSYLAKQEIRYERDGYREFRIPGGQLYWPFVRSLPGDFSSAAFFFCAAAVSLGDITVFGLDTRDSQADKAVLDHLGVMGCRIEIQDEEKAVRVFRSPGEPLGGAVMDLNDCPDALPALAAAACYAQGESRIVNVPQARLKETDRIAVMAAELSKMGAAISETPDGLVIRGAGGKGLRGAAFDGRGDHRVVMALAAAALGAETPSSISGAEAAGITFPGFFSILNGLYA
jgi:3-phosphoshikimate 1-carboxyvinyltransferase